MKRLAVALILVIFLIGLAIFEMYAVHHSADICLDNFKKIELLMKNKEYTKAKKLSNKTTQNYNSFSNKVLYCFLNHKDLDSINQTLFSMNATVENKNFEKYKEYMENTKKQLQAIKQQELFTIQNIL